MQYISYVVRSLPFRSFAASNLFVIRFAVAVTSCTVFATSSGFCTTTSSITAKMSDKTVDLISSAPTSYVAGSNSVAFVTTPDKESAKKLARSIVERKLAACVNIIPQIESIYMWEGKVAEDNECLMMIKTRTMRVDELTKFVCENHPYSVAEVISLPIQAGNLPYLNWITETVPVNTEDKS